MADKKVKIGNILDNLLPEFVTTDNPLFVDFLRSYYISEERDYGSIYLIDHLSELKNVESFAELIIGAINPATGQPFVPITLTKSVLHLDETIEVNTTVGFPNQYGLLRIENEVITYTGKQRLLLLDVFVVLVVLLLLRLPEIKNILHLAKRMLMTIHKGL